jgi:hypothetical protein
MINHHFLPLSQQAMAMLAAAPGHDHCQRHLAEGRGDGDWFCPVEKTGLPGHPPFLEEQMGAFQPTKPIVLKNFYSFAIVVLFLKSNGLLRLPFHAKIIDKWGLHHKTTMNGDIMGYRSNNTMTCGQDLNIGTCTHV